MKYWLIADSSVEEIKEGLMANTHAVNDYNCEDWPPGDGCVGCRGDESRRSALHALESGLHTTSEIPWDMKEIAGSEVPDAS